MVLDRRKLLGDDRPDIKRLEKEEEYLIVTEFGLNPSRRAFGNLTKFLNQQFSTHYFVFLNKKCHIGPPWKF